MLPGMMSQSSLRVKTMVFFQESQLSTIGLPVTILVSNVRRSKTVAAVDSTKTS